MEQADLTRRAGVIRELFPWEWRLYADHLLGLSPQDPRNRFMGRPSAAIIEKHARETLGTARAHVLGWFHHGRLRGAAELWLAGLWGRRRPAEAAFSVDPVFQRRGVGSALMRKALRVAGNAGASALEIYTGSSNRGMVKLAERFGGSVIYDLSDAEVSIPTPAPSLISIAGDVIAAEAALLASWPPRRVDAMG